MTNSILDPALDIVLLIFSVAILIMQLFFNEFKNNVEVRDRKGKLLRIDFKGLNFNGKLITTICFLSLSCGIWKAIRDNGSKNESNAIQMNMRDTVNVLNDKVTKYKEIALKQFKMDSAVLKRNRNADSVAFAKIQISLRGKGYGLDKNFNITGHDNSVLSKLIENHGSIGHIEMTNSGNVYQIQKH